jgi:hypothetical protein
MTLAELVRGRGLTHQKAAPGNSPRLVRLLRPSRPAHSADAPAPASSHGHSAWPTIDTVPERSKRLGSEPGPVGSEDREPSNDAFDRAVETMHEVLASVRAGTSLSVTILEAPLGALLESLRTSDRLLLPFFTPRGGSADPAQRAVNVGVLSMKIATQLNYAHDALLKLGLTALLHEGGVGWTHKDEPPRVQGLGGRYAGVSEVLVQLGERINGAGEASDAGSTEIRDHVHIVQLAGLIENLVRRKPVRPGLGHSEAIKEILKHERGTYPDQILKALIRVLATLPVGSLVRLNTGEICRVVAKNDGFPLRPTVMVLVRHRKRVLESTAIDLSQHPFLHIHGFVTEETLDREAEGGAP